MPHGVSDITLGGQGGRDRGCGRAGETRFVDYGHSASFADDLRGHITAFEAAEETQDAGQQKESGATAGFGPLLKEAITKVKQLDAFMHNFYKDNAEMMGEWKTASHVERQSKPKTPPPPPTP